MDEIAFGGVGASLVITIVLSIVYSWIPGMENKLKITIAVFLGLCFGLLKIPYDVLPWTVTNIVNNLLQGFLVGASAIGLDQMRRNAVPPIKDVPVVK